MVQEYWFRFAQRLYLIKAIAIFIIKAIALHLTLSKITTLLHPRRYLY